MTLTVTDRLELSDLVHRYAAYTDMRRFDDVAELFTATGRLTVPQPPGQLLPCVRHDGRAGVRTAMAALERIARTQHGILGEVYAETDGMVTGTIAGVAHHWTQRDDHCTDLVWYLRYDDRYLRTDSGWRIAQRALTIDAIEVRTANQVRA